MMHKITKGCNFAGAVRYAIDPNKDAQLLYAEGVLTDSCSSIIHSFELQAEMRQTLKKHVYHISLDFSAQDKERLTDEMMVAIAQEYLRRMKIKDTQYIIVKHNDKEHPHVHMIINRVNNEGMTVLDNRDRDRGKDICKQLTHEYGLYMARGKENVKRDRLHGKDKVKYEIFDAVNAVLPKCKTWEELQTKLVPLGITVDFKYSGSTDKVQGVKFTKDGISFSGSKVDRTLSYSKLTQQLEKNQRVLVRTVVKRKKTTTAKNSRSESLSSKTRRLVGGFVRGVNNVLNQETYVSDGQSEDAGSNGESEDEYIEENKWKWKR